MKWIDAVKNYYERKMATVFNIIDERISSKKKYMEDLKRDICELESLRRELLIDKIKSDNEDKEWKR